jgi:phosphate/sulfate permease
MTFLVIIIILALIFDYINGFHDAANSIATVVSTKVLTPFQAVLWAAVFNFIAFFIFKDHAVANTIGKTVHKEFITLQVIFAGLPLSGIFLPGGMASPPLLLIHLLVALQVQPLRMPLLPRVSLLSGALLN